MRLGYYPWSKEVMDNCLSQYMKGGLPTLDLQLSTKCSHASCIYCDSKVGKPQVGELTFSQIEKIFRVEGSRMKWVYICGVGEPIDDPSFFKLAELLYGMGIEISIFTNGLGITEDVANFLSDHRVSILLKLDSLNGISFDHLLGKKGIAQKVYCALENLLSVGYPMTDTSGNARLGLSIVPTRINYYDVPDVVEYCREHKIFPSIGELEYSGKAKAIYNELKLNFKELSELKKTVDNILGENYCRDLCPAAITGITIDNKGNCIVDQETGLSCSWFMLREPTLIKIGSIKDDSILTLRQKVINYRVKRIDMTIQTQESVVDYPFGGCGGSPKLLLESYLSIMENLK